MKKLLYFGIVVVLAFSCESPEITPSRSPLEASGPLIEYIKSLGFTDDEIIDGGNSYIVDGDIIFPKNMIVPEQSPDNSGGRTQQFFSNTVSASKRSSIRVFVDQPMANMMAEINGAVAHWNNVLNTSIRFVVVPSAPFDIIIRTANLPDGVCGQAPVPSGGSPGSFVEIDQPNLFLITGGVFAQRQRTIIHELGHTIGFLHTNEGGGSSVPGIPQTDGASLMNGGQCGIGAAVLSANDRFSTVFLYPIPAEELYIVRSGTIFAADYTNGIGLDLNTGWDQTVAMTGMGGFIYAVAAGSMYQINPNNNSAIFFSDFPNDWAGTEAMTSVGGSIYAVSQGSLWRVTVSNGDVIPFSDYPDGWTGTEAMAAVGSYIYAVQAGTLYQVNVSNGDVIPFSDYPNGWSDTDAMTAYGSYLYAVSQGTLWRVNLSNGDVTPFSAYPDGWVGTEAMVAKDGNLFATQGGALWKVNISTGSVSPVGSDIWTGTEAMAARL